MVRKLLYTLIVCGAYLQGVASADTTTISATSDADLKDRVLHQLADSDRDIARRVHVTTENGVVTLEATGLTSIQANRILVQVHAVPGVTKVDNRLHIGM
ncbi:MAG TPA: BON domain-containing protein [Steroidobacteraceae bacterium]|nr:BON domain-containing protein [Steroidobacteraceae bacterium]